MSASSPPTERELSVVDPELQILAFGVGNERFATPILSVLEIRPWESPTRIPNASPLVLGMLHVRGSVIPLVDLRRLVGSADQGFHKTTVTILFSLDDGETKRNVGLVVDRLLGVHHVPHALRADAPEAADPHVAGVATLGDDEMVILLCLEALVQTAYERQ